MQRFRATAFLARLVLAWFALALGVAMAAPLVQPKAMQLICGAGAVKLLQQDDGQGQPTVLTLDCALCAPAVAPPPAAVQLLLPSRPQFVPLEPVWAEREQHALLRPPARGPPPGQLG